MSNSLNDDNGEEEDYQEDFSSPYPEEIQYTGGEETSKKNNVKLSIVRDGLRSS
jgi:hypothetical protein